MKQDGRGTVVLTSIPLAVVLVLFACLAMPVGARADGDSPRTYVKAMSDYLSAQDSISFDYDASLEVVTTDRQKLMLASSGAVTLNRPDRIRATRSGGFADVEMVFDGKTLTLFGKQANLYARVEIPGTVDHLIDELRDTYGRPLPAADLLLSNAYDELMKDVVDEKYLGSGVIGGVECDYFAFRAKEVDWQIWIAQGDRPYPCQFVITTAAMDQAPQYAIRVRNWRAGDEVAADDFSFANATNAQEVDIKEISGADEMPAHFQIGGAQ